MRIESIEIRNFRGIQDLRLNIGGSSVVFVGENGAGKSSLIAAIARALGKVHQTSRADFGDRAQPLEIILSLSGFTRDDGAVFPSEISFQGPPTLRIGFRATWDAEEHETDGTCGFPDQGWRRASRAQRDALAVVWLPGHRDPERLLDLAAATGLWRRVLGGVEVDAAIGVATADIQTALTDLVRVPDLESVLDNLSEDLRTFIPDVGQRAFSLAPNNRGRDLLREFRLTLAHGGSTQPIHQQSSGLMQLAVFAIGMEILKRQPRAILLCDEPEISLHPHAQRALIGRLRGLPNQSIIATHSSNVLDRADLRQIIRLQRNGAVIVGARATMLNDDEAERLARFLNPVTAESCFARKVVFVEGPSDRIVVMRLAQRMGMDLDAFGISVLSLDGGCGIDTFLRLFGPPGLNLQLYGLCDLDKEDVWCAALNAVGIRVAGRHDLNLAGFFVCDEDIEAEFVRALTPAGVDAVLNVERLSVRFTKYSNQPNMTAVPLETRLRRFLHTQNTQLALPLVDALDLGAVPGVLNELIRRLA